MHMEGRRLRLIEHVLHVMLDKIYDAQNAGKGQVASLLLLDVSSIFDNVSHERFLYNLWKRRVNENIIRWVASFLSNRRTRIIVNSYELEEYVVEIGVLQESPLSSALYVLYNSDLIEECALSYNITGVRYIDDVAIFA